MLIAKQTTHEPVAEDTSVVRRAAGSTAVYLTIALSGFTALSAEVLYAHLDQSFEGSAAYAGFGAPLAKPAAVYSFGDQGTVSVNFRAQRNF